MHMKTSSAKWRPFCPGGDELMQRIVQVSTPIYALPAHNERNLQQ